LTLKTVGTVFNGIDNVRGGSYSNMILEDWQLKTLEIELSKESTESDDDLNNYSDDDLHLRNDFDDESDDKSES
jgi:hypothetical protein